jgi:hypothetical protein
MPRGAARGSDPLTALPDKGADAIHPEARNWLMDGLHHLGESFMRFFRTGARITRHPRQFAEDWASGEFRAFNPLAFFATAAGVTGTLGLFVERIAHHGGTPSSTDFIVHELDPYLRYFLLGLLCHAFLKPLGARRPWYMTLGISLFAGGGPAALADTLAYGLQVAVSLTPGQTAAAAVDRVAAGSLLLANGVFLIVLALGLAGIHRLRLWRIVVSLFAAEVALGVIRVLLFKFVIPEE